MCHLYLLIKGRKTIVIELASKQMKSNGKLTFATLASKQMNRSGKQTKRKGEQIRRSGKLILKIEKGRN